MRDPSTPVQPITLETLDGAVACIARRVIDNESLTPEEVRELAVSSWYLACARDNLTGPGTSGSTREARQTGTPGS